jgi:hypothetical protein
MTSSGAGKPEHAPEPEARAKPLRRPLPLADGVPDLVPARMINETLYCERLVHLEWSQGEFADNAFTNPINGLLSFTYSLLAKHFTLTLGAVGWIRCSASTISRASADRRSRWT